MLGRAYVNLGLWDEAKVQFESALETRRELAKGDDLMVATSVHKALASAHVDLARLLVLTGDDRGAEEQWRLALGLQREVLDSSHPAIGVTLLGLGELVLKAGAPRFVEAEDLLLESHGVLAAAFGPGDARTDKARTMMVSLYEAWKKPEDAAAWRSKELVEVDPTPH